VRYPDAGHWLNQQAPNSVNAEMVAFLTEEGQPDG
jgi:pimeloyl-ACP methyl ester carboxylesterase